MRYAIFSDIHGNRPAWNAVLKDMRALEVDLFVCLGDVVGYGPKPQEVLDGIRSVTSNFVLGNHDAAAAGILDASVFNPQAREVIEWTRKQLSDEAIEFLRAAPLVIGDEDVVFVHAEMEEPGRFGYIDSEEEARANFRAAQGRVTFIGHTHHPCLFAESRDGSVDRLADEDAVLDDGKRYIVNVGSVGEPRNPNDIRARYVIYDDDSGAVAFRKIEFDVEAYRAELRASGLRITPYFLRVVDHYQEALAQSQVAGAGHAMMVDMRVTSIRPVPLSKTRRQLVVPAGRTPMSGPKPRLMTGPVKQRNPMIVVALVCVLLAAVGGLILYHWEQPGPEGLVLEAQGDAAAGDAGAMVVGTAGGDPMGSATGAVAISPPAIPTGRAAGRWHFDEADTALGEPAMVVVEVGRAAEPLIDPVPSTGAANPGAVTGGVWQEEVASGWFGLAVDRSFTFECWYSAATAVSGVEIIAGNRGGPGEGGRGWELTRSVSDPGAFRFAYDPAGRSGRIELLFPGEEGFDEKPHHLALVWDHRAGIENDEGMITLFLDGEERGVAKIPFGLIAEERDGRKFCLGGRLTDPDNWFRGTLDEARFSLEALEPAMFLSAVGDGVKTKGPAPVAETNAVDEPSGEGAPILPLTDVISHWKMDERENSTGFADSVGKSSLGQYQSWSESAPIAPNPVPLTAEANGGAARVRLIGVEPESAGAFALKKDAGFTYEGWFHAGSEEKATLGTTLNGDEAGGWRVALLRSEGTRGFAAFMYVSGTSKVQALGADLEIFDDRAHHFAAVWEPEAAADAGRLSIFIDSEQVGSAMLPHENFAGQRSNPLQIGSGQNEVTVDELRFSAVALTPKQFLSAGDFVLFDFEGGSFDGWTLEGSAFGSQPDSGRVTATKAFSGQVGERLAHSSHGGDGATGKMTSAAFRITQRYLRVLVAGGVHDGKTHVGLEVDGKLVHSTTGHENLDLFEVLWDLSAFRNREARFVAVDAYSGRWGVIAFDHVVLTDDPGTLTPVPPLP